MKYLFWRTQIAVLRVCPPLAGVLGRISLGAANSNKVWLKSFLVLLWNLPRIVVQHLHNKLAGRVVMPRLAMPITTRCTLNCDKCVACIPDLTYQQNIPAEELIADIQKIFSCVDYVYATILTGGEAFLHPQLDEILWACANTGKTDAISIQSNATIMPNAKVLAALKNTNTTVKITQYVPALQPRVEQFKQLLREHDVRFTHESAEFWSDHGELGQFQSGCPRKRYRVCSQSMCMIYLRGKFHLCTRSAMSQLENKFPLPAEDFIDVRAIQPQEFARQWKALAKTRTLAACNYCLGNSYKSQRIPVGVQRKRKED